MNVNYELYRIFYTVAKNGNITKAAMELMISQPAISKSIKNLEEQLGGELFTRTKKGVTLTEEGKEFFKYIEQAILYINNAENKFSELINLDTGKITIGTSSTMLTSKFLMPYLTDFHKLYPKITIEIETGEISYLIKQLRNGILDVLVLMLPIDDYLDLNIIKCMDVQDYFIANKSYPALLKGKIQLDKLNNYPLLLPILDFDDRKIVDSYCISNNTYLNPSMELSSYTLIKDFTKAGFGIGVISDLFIQEEVENGELYKLDISPKIPMRSVGIAHLKKKEPSFSVQKLIDIITYKNHNE